MQQDIKTIVHLLSNIFGVLDQFKSTYEEKHQRGALLDKFQVMRKLQISDTTYRRHIKKGLLRPRRIGGTDYFYEQDLAEALKEGRRKGRI